MAVLNICIIRNLTIFLFEILNEAVDSMSLPVANGSLQRSDDSPVSKSESIAPGSSDAAADVNVVEKPQSEQEQQQSDSTEKSKLRTWRWNARN